MKEKGRIGFSWRTQIAGPVGSCVRLKVFCRADASVGDDFVASWISGLKLTVLVAPSPILSVEHSNISPVLSPEMRGASIE